MKTTIKNMYQFDFIADFSLLEVDGKMHQYVFGMLNDENGNSLTVNQKLIDTHDIKFFAGKKDLQLIH